MPSWLTAWRKREEQGVDRPVIELLVVAGVDAGAQFTIEGDEVLVGRGQPASGQTDAIRLEDMSISRRQAWIRADARGYSIEHIQTAANPTSVNGVEIRSVPLEVGDRVDMGRVSVDVRERAGMNLSGLTAIMEGAARAPTIVEPAKSVSEEITEMRPLDRVIGELMILRGAEDAEVTRFPILMAPIRIGRGEDVEVQIAELGVSRHHAEIEMSGRGLRLRHKSETNATLVNGFPVLDEVELADGDEIQLADQVVLGVQLARGARSAESGPPPNSGLMARMSKKIDLDRKIEEFNVMGSFLDVDVVASRKMKGADEKAEHIIVSFERFRSFVGGICEEWNGQVLNSNGDELMCFFESAEEAVRAGSTILERLADFNRDLNLLSQDFRFRLGAHTGVSLVDLDAGIAYSEVLDTAGHLQKLAEPNSLLISRETLNALPHATGLPVAPFAEMTGEAGSAYRITRTLISADFEGSSSS